jgi:hypothetical protein
MSVGSLGSIVEAYVASARLVQPIPSHNACFSSSV